MKSLLDFTYLIDKLLNRAGKLKTAEAEYDGLKISINEDGACYSVDIKKGEEVVAHWLIRKNKCGFFVEDVIAIYFLLQKYIDAENFCGGDKNGV